MRVLAGVGVERPIAGVSRLFYGIRLFPGWLEKGRGKRVRDRDAHIQTILLLVLVLFFRSLFPFVSFELIMHRISSPSSRTIRRAAQKSVVKTQTRGAHKEIKFSNEGRASILNGVDVLANAVSVTLGPKGTCNLFMVVFGIR